MRRGTKWVVAAMIATLALTGCEDHENPNEMNLRLAIECHEAGGEWVTVGKGGAWESTYQVCEFKHPETETTP